MFINTSDNNNKDNNTDGLTEEECEYLAKIDKENLNKRVKDASENRFAIYGIYNYADRESATAKEFITKFRPLYITLTYEEAVVAVSRLTYFHLYPEFREWCAHYHVTPSFDNSDDAPWLRFCQERIDAGIPKSQRYTIIELRYKPSNIVSVLRMFYRIRPLFVSFEDDQEYYDFIANAPDSKIVEAADYLDTVAEADPAIRGLVDVALSVLQAKQENMLSSDGDDIGSIHAEVSPDDPSPDGGDDTEYWDDVEGPKNIVS